MNYYPSFDHFFIGGEWVNPASPDQIEVISPTTEKPIAHVPKGTVADLDHAVEAARHAFDDGWGRSSLDERVSVLERLRGLIESAQEDLAQLITGEMGAPITQSRGIQAASPIGVIDSYLDAARQYPFKELRHSPSGASALVTRGPVGVVAAVTPWNVPLEIPLQKVIPSLLTGCTVVLKPASEAPLVAFVLAEMLSAAGLPPGVVNVVSCGRAESEHLITNPKVDKVTFTGSSSVGRRIASLCGQDLRRVNLELGGKSAAVILDDADLNLTIEALRLGSFRNNGQICTLKTRIIVSHHRHQEVVDRLEVLVNSMPLGDPSDEKTQIGPLVSARQRTNVEKYIDVARNEGATLVTGGRRPDGFDRGWYLEPTVFTGVKADMRIAQEEVFGPVVSVLAYHDEREAIAIANNSSYGLNGAVFSTDLEHGLYVAGRIQSGTVELNGSAAGLSAPMGGVKGSGIGRENGLEGLSTYTEPKSIGLPANFPKKERIAF